MLDWHLRHKNQNLLSFSAWILLGGFFMWLASGFGLQIASCSLRTEQNSQSMSDTEATQKQKALIFKTDKHKNDSIPKTFETAALTKPEQYSPLLFDTMFGVYVALKAEPSLWREASQRAPPIIII